MILMWLGSIALMFFGMELFRSGVSDLLAPLQKRFLNLPEPTGVMNMVATTKLCNLGQGSFLQGQYGAIALLNSRSFSRHYAILLLCLSSAGLWTTILGIGLAWQMSGEVFISAALVIYIAVFWLNRGKNLFKSILGLGVFLSAAEWALQKQSILLSLLGESDLHFLLADGRFTAQIVWLCAAFALTLVIGIESWAAFLALTLLVAGSLSLNGAVAFVIGELLAHVWMLWWRSRKLNQDVQSVAKAYAVSATVGLIIAFFLAGELREIFSWTYSTEISQIGERSLQFLLLYLVVIIAQALPVLGWGHFAARKKYDEVQKGEYFSTRWISQGLVSNSILDYIFKKLNERLHLLIDQRKKLNEDEKAQIPPRFLQDHEQEVSKLTLWIPAASEKHKEGSL